MAMFSFEAKAPGGKYVNGDVEAGSEVEARVKIRAQRLIPLKIVPKTAVAHGSKKAGLNFFAAKISPKELQVFTRQFAVLIGAGVPVMQSLEAMTGSSRSPLLNNALLSMMDSIATGNQLADAMKKHPSVFDSMYVNLIRAGEEGGALEVILERLAQYIEKSVKLKGKVKGALFYPCAIVGVATLVISAIMIFVIPSFVKMFADSGQELPGLTTIVINISSLFVSYWYMLLVVGIAIPIALLSYYKTPEGRAIIDPILLKIPIFGDLIIKGAIAKFSRTLSTMLTAGVRVVESLDIAASVCGNYVVEGVLMDAKDVISKGRTISEVFVKAKVIPDMVGQMISVGEQTGNLDTMLEKIADFYEDEVDAAAEGLTSLIEPILMVVLGGVIAVIVIAMYLPVFNLAGAVGG